MDKIHAIVGPTASGKTEIAFRLAKLINAEIISADSRQIYKDIPIATASPPNDFLIEVKHHFINLINLEKEFNAGEYGIIARNTILELINKKIPVLLVGGSGLYLKSVIDGFFNIKINSKKTRIMLENKLNKLGKDYLYEELKKVDPETAARNDSSKVRRIIRALEIYYETGQKISSLQEKKVDVGFETIQIGLKIDRRVLYDRINKRVDSMIENGLIEEVSRIYDRGLNYNNCNSLNTVGIKEVMLYLEKNLKYDEMISLIKQNTRRYAKRQLTWFNKDKRIFWFEISENMIIDEIIELIYTKYFR